MQVKNQIDDRKFRNAMGKFATGITVVTTELDGEVHGMTANAFMSVSLDPKLVVISIGEKAQMLEKIKRAKKYAVSILSEQQKDLSMHFSGQQQKDEDIDFEWRNVLPVLRGSLTTLVCNVVSEYTEGDHTLFIGEVTDLQLAEEEQSPILYYSGSYRSVQS